MAGRLIFFISERSTKVKVPTVSFSLTISGTLQNVKMANMFVLLLASVPIFNLKGNYSSNRQINSESLVEELLLLGVTKYSILVS